MSNNLSKNLFDQVATCLLNARNKFHIQKASCLLSSPQPDSLLDWMASSEHLSEHKSTSIIQPSRVQVDHF